MKRIILAIVLLLICSTIYCISDYGDYSVIPISKIQYTVQNNYASSLEYFFKVQNNSGCAMYLDHYTLLRSKSLLGDIHMELDTKNTTCSFLSKGGKQPILGHKSCLLAYTIPKVPKLTSDQKMCSYGVDIKLFSSELFPLTIYNVGVKVERKSIPSLDYYYMVNRAGEVAKVDRNFTAWNVKKISTGALYKLVYSHNLNLFITVGSNGGIFTSHDFVTWIKNTIPGISSIFAIDVKNSYFVIGDGKGSIAYSSDGTTWNKSVTPSAITSAIVGIQHTKNKFIASTLNGNIITSPEGKTWKMLHKLPIAIYSIIYAKGLLVAVGGGNNAGEIYTSIDGVTWSKASIKNAKAIGVLRDVIYEHNLFVAVGFGGTILRSFDGINWDKNSTNQKQNLLGVTYNVDSLVAVGGNATLLTSYDGINWIKRNTSKLTKTATIRDIICKTRS